MQTDSSRELVLSTLASDAFVSVNKKILRALNGDATVTLLLSELIAFYRYSKSTGEPDIPGDSLFEAIPVSLNRLTKTLGMSPYRQRTSLERLQANGLVYSFLKGMPARRYVSIDFKAIEGLLYQEDEKAREEIDRRIMFYEGVNATIKSILTSSDVKTAFTQSTLGNISYPLKDAMVMVSLARSRSGDVTPEWTPQGVGVLKGILSMQPKTRVGAVEFRRLWNALPWNTAINDPETQIIFELNKRWKRELPVEPSNQAFDFATIYNTEKI